MLYDERLNEMGNLGSNSFDSHSTARTENLSVHQVEKDEDDDDDDASVKSNKVNKASPPNETVPHLPQEEDSDDESVLDQAAQMAALVATKPPVTSPTPPQAEKQGRSENRASEPRTKIEEMKEQQPGQFKMPVNTQKLTMAQAKEVLKAAKKSNGAIQQTTPMFLEMEPEPKYADHNAPKTKEWPPKKKEQASVPKSCKPPSRTSKPVDRFGYMAALKDKSNTADGQKQAVREEWW